MGLGLILLLVTVALWATSWRLLQRLRPPAGRGEAGRATGISVIIPARNEEHNLPKLLRSLKEQKVRPEEVLVVDDGSSDSTAERARELGAKVLTSEALPEGWRGKAWACHQGAKVARGQWLLFLDADTWFPPDGLSRIVAAYPGGAFSVGPYHAVQRWYEQLSLFFNLNMILATVPAGLFGQMLLVDREGYRRAGGHEAVKGRILENAYLATRLREAGIPVGSAAGGGLLSFRMYPNGLRELIEGWTKGFAAGAGRTPRGTMGLIVLWIIGLMLAPLGAVVSGEYLRWGVVYLLCAVQIAWFGRRIGSFHWASGLFYPIPLMFFFAVFAWSVARSGKSVSWKGRKMRAD